MTIDNVITRVMADTFEGNQRSGVEEAPFFSIYGWSGIVFDDDDLRGTYVLGEPEILEGHLIRAADTEPGEVDSSSALAAVQTRIAGLGRFFRRSEDASGENGAQDESLSLNGTDLRQDTGASLKRESRGIEEEGQNSQLEEDSGRFAFAKRLRGQVGRFLRREKPESEAEAPDETTIQESVFTFAYIPDRAPLHTPTGEPVLPDGLIPLCDLRYSEQVRPEAVETIKGFAETGVGIKVFAGSDPERAASILQQAGLEPDVEQKADAHTDDTRRQTPGAKSTGQAGRGTDDRASLGAVSGAELAEMKTDEFREAVRHNTIFSHLVGKQASQIVKALRDQGESVAVVGDGVNDLSPMRQANLSVARQNSSQSALSVADIVLLESSSSTLLGVLNKGQRIVNGLLDVLKLYLTQVFYLAMLIVAIRLFADGFPYTTEHGTAIGVITLSIPSLALSLLATAGIVKGAQLSRQLTQFVAPAAVAIAAAGLVVYGYFLNTQQDLAYAQLALAYTLVTIGLVLVVFVQPPRHLKPGRDWVFALGAVVLMAIFLVLPAIRLAQKYLGLYWLRQPTDYLIVGIVVLCWGVVLQLVWLLMRRRRAT
jgi:cation-transporting ATPase E